MIIGMDGGGSSVKTIAFVGGTENSPSRFVFNQPGNFLLIGSDGLGLLLTQVLQKYEVRDVASVKLLIGLAGGGSREAVESIRSTCMSLGFGDESVFAMTDADLAMKAIGDKGVLLIAGTGAVCIGRVGSKREMAGGWGYLVGSDSGSAFYLGSLALRILSRRNDGLDTEYDSELSFSPHDWRDLELVILTYYSGSAGRELKNLVEARPYIYSRLDERKLIAGLAPQLYALAQSENKLCLALIKNTAECLAELVSIVLQKLSSKEKLPLALWGGMFSGDYSRKILHENIVLAKSLVAYTDSFEPTVLEGECILSKAIRFMFP